VTVEVSMVSLTVVTAAVLLIARISKLPPEALVMWALTWPASIYGSSAGAATATLPEV